MKVEGGTPGTEVPPPGPTRVEAAEAALPALVQRAADPKAEAGPLRDDLLAFQRQYAGTVQSARAGGLLGGVLARLPSPLDRLRAEQVAEYDLAAIDGKALAAQHAELVGVFGDSRLRHWGGVSSVALRDHLVTELEWAAFDGELLASFFNHAHLGVRLE